MMEFVVLVLLLTVQTYGRMVDFDLTYLFFTWCFILKKKILCSQSSNKIIISIISTFIPSFLC